MGQCLSNNYLPLHTSNVNYDCPVCRNTEQLPNIAGKFFIINETQCQCNGCNTVFDKKLFYKTGILTVELNEAVRVIQYDQDIQLAEAVRIED
jgi:hypothetical protein